LARTIPQAVHELCLAFPETEDTISHGSPDYKVAGKSFAYFTVNHHGDGHVAFWLRSPQGTQQHFVALDPKTYFVPQYVGPRGWLGVELNQGVAWDEVSARVREAWENSAPASLASELGATPRVAPPEVRMQPEEIDPWLAKRPKKILDEFHQRCMRLPEVNRDQAFGSPVWKAGKKTFAGAYHRGGRAKFQFRVGVAQQAMMVDDPRFSIPAYMGNKGWIDLDVEEKVDWTEVEGLLETSYRHFAIKRMLKALDGE
jgi:hypothetical protein